MRKRVRPFAAIPAALLLGWLAGAGRLAPPAPAEDTSIKRPFAHVPDTVSAEARRYLATLADPATKPALPAPGDVAGWKRAWEAAEAAEGPAVASVLARYGPTVEARKLGGVPVLDIRPKGWRDDGKVLVHAHGGAYALYSARSRLQGSVPAAAATGLRVISVDYTVAPAGRWETVTDEVLAVVAALREDGYGLEDIALYGESAGGGLVAASVLKMRDRGLGMPAAVVLWSPWADITDSGDSAVTLKAADPVHVYERHLKPAADAYADPKDQRHPYVSPIYGDFAKGYPPVLIQGGTKEIFLSHMVRLYRAVEGTGGTAVLDLYDGMPHIFQVRPAMADAPETKAALAKMAAFLRRHLGK